MSIYVPFLTILLDNAKSLKTQTSRTNKGKFLASTSLSKFRSESTTSVKLKASEDSVLERIAGIGNAHFGNLRKKIICFYFRFEK